MRLTKANIWAQINPYALWDTIMTTNVRLWKKTFWEVWDPLPLDEKLMWLAFVGQTLAVITLIQLLLFKK